MGIIIRQTIKGTIWSYLGVGIGFVTMSYLFPRYLTTDVIGLLSLLVAYSLMFGQIFSLGFNGVTARLFPYFRNPENGHNGYLFIATIVFVIGSLLFLLVFFVISPIITESNLEKTLLFSDYIYLIIPLTLATIIFRFLDIFNKLLFNAVLGTFLGEFIQRVLILLVTILFIIQVINLHQLIIFYSVMICVKAPVIFIYLLLKKEMNLKPNLSFINKKLKREMLSVAGFSILAGFGAVALANVDKIIINHLLDLNNTGVYTIAFFFGTLIIIPSRPLLKISGTVISEAWKRNDLTEINEVYYKSCLNQFIIGSLLFVGIWANIDNILLILGADYHEAKWVIFFVGLGYLMDMMTGANGQIISLSKHYRVMFIFALILILLVVGCNFLFIPLWGITGAAIAAAVSMFLNNLMRYIYLFKVYKFQPFNLKFVIVFFALIFTYLVNTFIPQMDLIIDIIIRSSIITGIFGSLIIVFNVSENIKEIIQILLKKLR
jgi:O-antigen/teichoic acid export membrane protein